MNAQQFTLQIQKLNEVNLNLIALAVEVAQKAGTLNDPAVRVYEDSIVACYLTINSVFIAYGASQPLRKGMERHHAKKVLERNYNRLKNQHKPVQK